VKVINSKEVSNSKYSYLIPIVNKLLENPDYIKDKNKMLMLLQKSVPA
jgi:hypothetical protein